MQFTIAHPMAPSPTPTPTTVPQATVTVPAGPPQSTVTVTAPAVPQIPQWNPGQPVAPAGTQQGYQVQPMPQTAVGDGGGVSIGGILGFLMALGYGVFVVVVIVISILAVGGKERANTKKTLSVFGTVALAALLIALVSTGAWLLISNGVVQSVTSGVGG